MKRVLKAAAAILLMMVFAVGCNKPDEPNNGGDNVGQNDSIVDPNNGGNNGGGNGGGNNQYYQVSVSASVGGSVTGGGSYLEGDTCTVSAIPEANYAFADWTENGSSVSSLQNYSFAVTGDRSLEANFIESNAPTGAINGLFTINANGDQVYFSQGNLRYQASTNIWEFAEQQYYYLGNSNSNISQTNGGWIDLFGWGTSGYNHGAVCYQPWSTSEEERDYYAYGSDEYSLYDVTGYADWGYNAIGNGGNTEGQWRTLTRLEWSYIFNTRSTTSGMRYTRAQVNNVDGLILLPDNWSNNYYNLIYSGNYSGNVISSSIWVNSLEAHGAVFLPAAGYRIGSTLYGLGNYYMDGYGHYWSASCYGGSCAYSMVFGSNFGPIDYDRRCYGLSVRLVCPAE